MSLSCRDSVHDGPRTRAFPEPTVLRRIGAFHALIGSLAVVALSLLPALPSAAVPQGTLEVDHDRFYRAGERLALSSLAGLDELDSGMLEEAHFTYNMVRSELAVEWLLDGAVIDRSTLARGLGERASRDFSRRLPATIEVRFVGPSGQVQVTSVGVVVAGEESSPPGDVTPTPTGNRISVQDPGRPLNLELRQPLDFETVAGLRSVPVTTGEPGYVDARAGRLRYPAGNGDSWATAVPHLVEIDGIHLGEGVRLVSALTARLAVVAHDDPSRGTPVLRPGKASYDHLVMAGPMPVSGDVASWFEETVDGRVHRRSGSVVVLNRAGEEEQRYVFFDSWPTRLSVDVTTGTWSLTLALMEIDFQPR